MVRNPHPCSATQGRWRIATLFYIFLIYTTLPFTPGFWRGVESVWGDAALGTPIMILAAGWGIALFCLRKSYRVFPYLFLAALAQFLLISQVQLTFEKFHVIQYGILGFFCCAVPGSPLFETEEIGDGSGLVSPDRALG